MAAKLLASMVPKVAVFLKIETGVALELFVELTTAKSFLPSPSISPMATDFGFAVTAKSTLVAKLPVLIVPMVEVLRNIEIVLAILFTDISSGLLSELVKFTTAGGALVFIPAQNVNLINCNKALTSLQLPNLVSIDTTTVKIDKIELASKFYTGVFDKLEDRLNLPQINKHYKLVKTNANKFETILQLQNSDAFFGVTVNGNSQSYLFTSPLNQNSTNFNKHALFVPTMYRICFSSLKASPLFYPTNSNVVISLKSDAIPSEQPPHIKQLNSQLDIIPEIRTINNNVYLYTRNQISANGFYQVLKNDVSVLPLAFNFSRKESNLSCYQSDELAKLILELGNKNLSLIEDTQSYISKQILQNVDDKKLWKLFILLSLLFVAIEILLLRFLK